MRWNWILFNPRAWVDYTKFRLSCSMIRREDANNTEKCKLCDLVGCLVGSGR